ncbi:MAG: methylmalonyl Co-A mutase-associated GTPase MeaB [Bdellovibrionales bacterium]|jgi:LAO/AO transport system kinase|nr:methylmalonyl Co-A mutase-associated GTPase MeaB [Bdellovibrionales bacterium]
MNLLRELIEKSAAGDRMALAKLLTQLERRGPRIVGEAPELLEPSHSAFRVGITGPPGAGKSTLISRLIGEWRSRGKTVAVLAVDPSSPFTQGAILGDRIRYSDHVLDQGVFIRSLGSRGSLGGLSASAWLMVRAFDLAKFDVVLMETVGVGQTELEIMNVADHVSVCLTPESGDGIQGMKAGLMEIANLFVVNKSDRPGADVFAREIEAAVELDPRSMGPDAPKVLKISALTGLGVTELVEMIEEKRTSISANGGWKRERQSTARLKAEAKAMLMIGAERAAELRASQIHTPGDLGDLFRTFSES